MPEVMLMIWEDNMDAPVANEVEYSIVPRVGDYLDLPSPDGRGGSVYRVFAVVVAHEGEELAADVHVECISEPMTPSVAFIKKMRMTRR
jgi:hypothetical protein